MKSLDVYIESATSTRDKLLYSGIQLFSVKGYSNVGIRNLCSSVGIKESSFYNHFKSKEALFISIMTLLTASGDTVIYTDSEIDMIIASKDIEWFMLENLHKIQNIFSNPLFMAGMRLVIMESYINPIAYELSENNNYNEVAEVTVRILKMYMDKGSVIRCDADQVVHSYYNGLNSLNETYLLNDTWGKEQSGILMEMEAYTRMYIDLLMGRIGHE